MRPPIATVLFQQAVAFLPTAWCASRRVPPRETGLTRSGLSARSISMFDIVLLAIGLGFFVLSIAYAYVCERL
jgi:hypothetical protein